MAAQMRPSTVIIEFQSRLIFTEIIEIAAIEYVQFVHCKNVHFLLDEIMLSVSLWRWNEHCENDAVRLPFPSTGFSIAVAENFKANQM